MAEHEPITTVLPPDIALFHILPRLPVKSVTRFKCVSKQWHSFITTPAFPKMHLLHQNQQKLIFLPNNTLSDFFTIDCETPEDGCTPFRPLPFKVRPNHTLSIATSLHGMVCVLVTKPVDTPGIHDIILWNPATGEHKTLSKAGSHKDCYETSADRFGLYYSSSEDDYKLVCLTRRSINVYIYSLKSDSWRKVESTSWCSDRLSYRTERSVLLNEKLYFLNIYSVKTFDTQTEKLRDIETPHFKNQRTSCNGFMVVQDCIYFLLGIVNPYTGWYDTIGEWTMDGDGDWTKVEASSSKENLYWSYDTQHLMRNGNCLMYSRSKEHVYVLDANKHTKHIICSVSTAFRPEGRFIDFCVAQSISQVKPCTLLS